MNCRAPSTRASHADEYYGPRRPVIESADRDRTAERLQAFGERDKPRTPCGLQSSKLRLRLHLRGRYDRSQRYQWLPGLYVVLLARQRCGWLEELLLDDRECSTWTLPISGFLVFVKIAATHQLDDEILIYRS